MVEDGVEVFSLARGFGFDRAGFGMNVDLVGGTFASVVGGVADGFADVIGAEPILSAEGALELIENGGGLADFFAVAEEADFFVASDDLNAEGIADEAEVFIRRAEESELLVGLFEGDVQLHRFSPSRDWLAGVRGFRRP